MGGNYLTNFSLSPPTPSALKPKDNIVISFDYVLAKGVSARIYAYGSDGNDDVASYQGSGLLNGIFGSGNLRHISFWQAVKVLDKTEEEEDGVITVREKERFSNELTLVYSTDEVAILK